MPFLLLNNHDCDLDCKLRNKRFDEKNINCLSNCEVSITSYSPETLHAMHSKRFTICTFDVTWTDQGQDYTGEIKDNLILWLFVEQKYIQLGAKHI